MHSRVQVAVIGVGHWGPNLLRALVEDPRTELRWVVDARQERLTLVRQRHPWAQLSRDPRDALTDSDVDAVVIASPAHTHFELAAAALAEGKHVLVEKPLTDTLDSAARLVELADASGRVVMVGHTFLYNLAVRRVKEYLDEGRLGRPQYIAMTRTNLGPIRADVGAAWDLAAHDVAIANYWLGSLPTSVVAVGGSWINAGTEDVVLATMKYPDGVLVGLHASWLNPQKSRQITVVGDTGMLTFDDLNLTEPIRLFDKGVAPADEGSPPPEDAFVDSYPAFRSSVREGDIVVPRVVLEEPLRVEIAHFADAIVDGTSPMTDARSGYEVVAVLAAISASMAAGGGDAPVDLSEEHIDLREGRTHAVRSEKGA